MTIFGPQFGAVGMQRYIRQSLHSQEVLFSWEGGGTLGIAIEQEKCYPGDKLKAPSPAEHRQNQSWHHPPMGIQAPEQWKFIPPPNESKYRKTYKKDHARESNQDYEILMAILHIFQSQFEYYKFLPLFG